MDRIASRRFAADWVVAARQISEMAARRAGALDRDGGFPAEDVRDLATAGLLAAPVPSADGGAGLCEDADLRTLAEVLREIGAGSLALGRIYEGHVNALDLVARYGSPGQRHQLFRDAIDGLLFGVWNTEPSEGRGLTLSDAASGFRLDGVKTFASGAGYVARALVTARREATDPPLMLIVPLEPGDRSDVAAWQVHGMRASATGTVDFTGIEITKGAMLGEPNDYHRQPHFSGGAWRFAAVQLGGIEAVFDAWMSHIGGAGRGADLHQLARLGEGATAVETARHWVERAAAMVAQNILSPDRVVAFVNLARLAVERSGLDVLQLAQRSVGLQGFLHGHPLERLSRDLATYLRQPAPDRALTTAAAEILRAPQPVADMWRI